jgi:polyhydroxybutyrate depolymerase
VAFAFACYLPLFAMTASAATTNPAAKPVAKPIDCVTAPGKSPIKLESRCMRLPYDGKMRTFRLYKPKVSPKGAMPLLLVLHGGGGSGSNMEALTLAQFNRIADMYGVVVAYPDGVGGGWNDGRSTTRIQAIKEGVDDVGFIRALVAHIAAQTPINHKRVYATGISNGGLMSFRLACDASDLFTAVAPVAANLSVELATECKPARMIPLAIMNGTDDPMMPWLGGDIRVLGTRRGEVLSAQDTFERWASIGDCALPNTHMKFDRDAKKTKTNSLDQGTVITHVARDCTNFSELRLYEIIGGGHTWPGGYQYLSERIVGRVSHELNASNEIWKFFRRFER